MSPALAWRGAAALLWALAFWNALAYRGLFWDGASFLVHMIEDGRFHAGHTARSHVLWATQWPVVVALWLGIKNTATLSMIYSFGLFALPTALYHLALYRVRDRAALLAAVLAIVVAIYLSNSFFIVGEFNAAYAAVTAGVAVALTTRNADFRDGALLCVLAFLCLRSYEAMVYLGAFMAAMTAWAVLRHREGSAWGRLWGLTGAGFFIGATIVSFTAAFGLWDHDYYVRVRAASLDFWQNLQFMIALVTVGTFVAAILLRPSWLRHRGIFVILATGAAVFAASPWLHEFRPQAQLFPPAHYVARSAAGALLLAMLAAMWLFVAWTHRPPRLFTILKEGAVGRRLTLAMAGLFVAAMVPDIALTRMWGAYLDGFRSLVVGHSGTMQAGDAGLYDWPGKLFRQDWSYPALSLLLRQASSNAIVMPAAASGELPLYDPACGLPMLAGYVWR